MPVEFIDEMEIKEWCLEELEKIRANVDTIAPPIIKSIMKCGNTHIHNTRRFNWFQRLMWKWCFGVEIENVEEHINDN